VKRRAALAGLALFALGTAARTGAQEVRARQNIEYRLISSLQPVETGASIEVIDFFWYGCPYCNELQPSLEAWLKRKPADVTLRRIPAILRDSWAPHARIYYALELLGEIEHLHLKVYEGYHVGQLHMSKADVVERWAEKHGIDRKRWLDAYFSPETDARIARAHQATKRYEVQGTPSLVVDGRFITSSGMVSSLPALIAVVEDLVRLARQGRGQQ